MSAHIRICIQICITAFVVAALASSGCATQRGDGAGEGEIAFGIPAGAGNESLDAFIQQSNLQVTYPIEDLQSVQTRPVTGSLRPADALARLLSGTELRYAFLDDSTVVITRRPEE